MLVVETIARIRRDHLVKGVPIKKIARDLRVSKNTVRKVVRGDETSFSYARKIQPMPKLGPWVPNALGRLRTRLSAHDDGDRQFVKVLAAVLEDGLEAVEAACAEALACGACSADVVLNILARQREPAPPASIPTPEGLWLRHQPVADCRRYDRLRGAGHGAS